MFPPPGTYFKMFVKNRVIDVKIDNYNRIYVGSNVRDLLNFETNNIIVLTKNQDGTFSLSSTKS
jgi:DNA-binding transcriptional regulator/RsmH inhibitor MraZ